MVSWREVTPSFAGPPRGDGEHGCGQPPQPLERRHEVGDEGGVAYLQGHGAVRVGRDERDGPVEQDEALGDLVEGADRHVAAQLFVVGQHGGGMPRGVLVEGAHPASPGQEFLLDRAGRGKAGGRAPATGLDGEELLGGDRAGFADRVVDPLGPQQHMDHRRVLEGRPLGVERHERCERLGQFRLSVPLVRDLVLDTPQQSRQGHGGRHGALPPGVVRIRAQQPDVEEARNGRGVLVLHAALAQGPGVERRTGGAQLLGSVSVGLGGHVWLSSVDIQ